MWSRGVHGEEVLKWAFGGGLGFRMGKGRQGTE